MEKTEGLDFRLILLGETLQGPSVTDNRIPSVRAPIAMTTILPAEFLRSQGGITAGKSK
jgi:hypothetical protein